MQTVNPASTTSVVTRGVLIYALVCAVVVGLVFPYKALAYVDPSVVTYAVQAIAGVAVAISAVVGVAFRKVRKRIFDLLGVDAEAKKQRDPSYFEFPQATSEGLGMTLAEADRFSGADSIAELTKVGARRTPSNSWVAEWSLSYPKRVVVATLVVLLSFGSVLVLAPLETVAGNTSDFFFGVSDIFAVILPKAAAIMLVSALLLSLLRGRAFSIVVTVLFAVGLCFYLQAMLLNAGLPLADGKAVDWYKYDDKAIVSTIVWVCVLVASLAALVSKPRITRAAVTAVTAALVLVQGIGLASLLADASNLESSSGGNAVVTSENGLFDLSPNKNVVLFVLDTYDTEYLESTLEMYPDLLDSLTGFTWYKNVAGAMIPTRYGIPFLLTGEWPHADDTIAKWRSEMYTRSDFLEDISRANFSAGVYSNNLFLTRTKDKTTVENTVSSTLNITHAGALVTMDEEVAFQQLVGCALYRNLPWILKPRFRFDTYEVSGSMVVEPEEYAPETTLYLDDDAAYYKKLRKLGVSAVDRGGEGAFRFIHLVGAHTPYNINEDGVSVETSSLEEQCAGSMRMVEHYLNQMKREGLYDSATIIITADHGRWYETLDDIQETSTPIILAKPSQDSYTAQTPITVSGYAVSHEDVIPTVISAIGGDSSKYGGKSLFDYDENDDLYRPRYYFTTQQSPVNHEDYRMVRWEIVGDALDFGNWARTELTIEAN